MIGRVSASARASGVGACLWPVRIFEQPPVTYSHSSSPLPNYLSSTTKTTQPVGETEAAYRKILESSQTLLHVLKRESHNLLNGGSSGTEEGLGLHRNSSSSSR